MQCSFAMDFETYSGPRQVSEYTALGQPRHPNSARLLECWQEKQSEGGFIMGRDIPSRALARVLHSLMVAEPVNNRSDFKVRLAGTALRRRWGREITGLSFSDLFKGDNFARQMRDTTSVIDGKVPVIIDAKQIDDGFVHNHREAVVLPILAPDRATAWILAGIFYFD